MQEIEQQEQSRPLYVAREEQEAQLLARFEDAMRGLAAQTNIDVLRIRNFLIEAAGTFPDRCTIDELRTLSNEPARWSETIEKYGEGSLNALKDRSKSTEEFIGRHTGRGGTLISYEEALEDLADVWHLWLRTIPDADKDSRFNMLDDVLAHGTPRGVVAAVDWFSDEFFLRDEKLAQQLAPWSWQNGWPSRRNAQWKIDHYAITPVRYLELSVYEDKVYNRIEDSLEGTSYGETVRVRVHEGTAKEQAVSELGAIVEKLEQDWDDMTDPNRNETPF